MGVLFVLQIEGKTSRMGEGAMSGEGRVRKHRRARRLLVGLIIVAVGVWLIRSWLAGPSVPEGSYLLLDIEGAYSERPPDELAARLLGERRIALIDLLLLIRDASEDTRVDGMVIRVRRLDIGWAKAQDIRDALLAFRATGKPLRAYLERDFYGGSLEYYVASAAEKIYVPPGAAAPLNGLLAEYVFLGGVWEKLDVDMQVVKIREYKTAGDMLVNKEMSPHHREMANSLLDSLYGQLVGGIATARDLQPDVVQAVINTAPATPSELVGQGLTDGTKFLGELRAELVGADGKFLDAAEYQINRRPLPNEGEAPEHRIGVVYGVGQMVTGESRSGPMGDSISVGSDTMAEAFREATADEAVKAIVFRVDSPGGSALASDQIWHTTQEARSVKPVIVSMSDVAGSGGYYVAAGATRIIAQPGTLTGSIGVVVAKPNISGFLGMLGINTESLARGELAQMTSLTQSFNSAELTRVTETMNHVYDLFVGRVAEGRSLDRERVDQIGRGRVWTGEQAQAKGLVDELGGFMVAINAAKMAAGIPVEGKVDLVFYPRPRSLIERLVELLEARAVGDTPAWWRRVRAGLAAYDFPAGSVLTLMPQEIEIR